MANPGSRRGKANSHIPKHINFNITIMKQDHITGANSVAEIMAANVDRLVAFHQVQILPDSSEEDIEMRERQIIRLQHEFSAVRSMLRELPISGN